MASKKNKKRSFILLKRLFLAFFIFSLLSLLAAIAIFIYYARDLPRPEKFTEREFYQSSKLYDRTGKILLYNIYGEEKRTIIDLQKIPNYLQKAVVATEDANFYNHIGIDWKSILRSVILNIEKGKAIYGGSTISQQLIRSSYLTREKTIKRKFREVILTLELERRYPKEKILEWYLNQIPFCMNCYGVEAAAQTFFGKPVSDLTLAESAVLAALIQAPSYYCPYGPDRNKLLERKDFVLARMVNEGYITTEEMEKAKTEEIKFQEILNPIKAPHFSLYVKDLLEKKYGREFMETKGLKIYTSLDWELQQEAEKMAKEKATGNANYHAYNLALVAINPKNGQVISMIGSADWFGKPYPANCIPGDTCLFDPKFDEATSTPGRQPGSAFKPIVYAQTFMNGYSDQKIVVDEWTDFGVWGGKHYIPMNFDGKFRGPVTLRQALAQSLNVPSVKVLNNLAGLDKSIKLAREFGITTLNEDPSFYGLAIVLGGGEVKLLDLTSAYSVFALEGQKIEPQFVLRIEDAEGNIIEENRPSPKRIIPSETARLISDILSDNKARAPIFGFNSPLYIKEFPVAAKTGTTTGYKDGWCIGYTPSLAVGVWGGNSNNSPIWGEPGVKIAAPLWHEFFLKASQKYRPESFIKP